MSKVVYIYSLSDPDTAEVRYIGKTVNLKSRYSQHLSGKGCSVNNHKNNWIKKLLSENKLPIIGVVEETDEDNWRDREIYWISQYDNLTNGTIGGDGIIITDQVIKKMRENNTGEKNPMWGKKWTEEQRKKLSDQRIGISKSDEWKNKVSETLGHKCIINGIQYRSIKHAKKELRLSFRTIKKILTEESTLLEKNLFP